MGWIIPWFQLRDTMMRSAVGGCKGNDLVLESLSFSRDRDDDGRKLPTERQLLQHLVDSGRVSIDQVKSSYQTLIDHARIALNDDGSAAEQPPSAPLPKNNTMGSRSDTTALNDPAHTFCFLVGCKSDWEGKDRDEIGDRALFKKLETIIPDAQCTYLADEQATAGNCQRRLEEMLKRTTSADALVFYYGGHGHWRGFNTEGRRWKHVQVVDTIERYFCGHTVLLLVDCCNAANMIQILKETKHPARRCNYICLASSPPFRESGPTYSMTACLLDALEHGSPKIPRGVAAQTEYVTLSDLIAYMADRHALEKGDLLCSYVSGNVDPATPFLTTTATATTKNGHSITSGVVRASSLFAARPTTSMVQDDAPTFARVPAVPEIGARVYYRHPGGVIHTLQGESMYCYPSWFEARVVGNSNDGGCRIRGMDPLDKNNLWEVTVDPSKELLLNDVFMGLFCDVGNDFITANVQLAKQFKYIDFSAFRAGTKVRALWWDGILHPGVVLDYMEVDWEGFLENNAGRDFPAAGPHVPVRWVLEGNAWDMVPVSRIIVAESESPCDDNQDPASIARFIKETSDSALARAAEEFTSERQVLIKSIESAGKTIVNARTAFGTSKLKYFWPTDDRDWNDGHAVCIEDVDLFEMARHANYDVSGEYCAMHCPKFWCQDYTTTIYPIKYVARRDDPKVNEN